MDQPRPLPLPELPPGQEGAGTAQVEARLQHLFRHAAAADGTPHPLLRLLRLYRAAQPGQEPDHG